MGGCLNRLNFGGDCEILNFYNKFLKPHPVINWGIVAVIIYLFING